MRVLIGADPHFLPKVSRFELEGRISIFPISVAWFPILGWIHRHGIIFSKTPKNLREFIETNAIQDPRHLANTCRTVTTSRQKLTCSYGFLVLPIRDSKQASGNPQFPDDFHAKRVFSWAIPPPRRD